MFARRLFDFPSMGWQQQLSNLERMSRQMNRLTQAAMGSPGMNWLTARVFPAVNLTEDKDRYYVRAELPGIKADALDIQVNGRNLAISGERTIPSEGENIRYHRKERESGKFSRIIGLPGDIDADHVEAKMVNGVLTVAISKSAASRPKQITVN
jgi:HSP20 family protein